MKPVLSHPGHPVASDRRAAAALSTLLACGALGLLAPSQAHAQDTALYNWPDASVPVAIVNTSGVIFLGKDKSPLRAYAWKANRGANQRPVYVVDMDGDRNPEVVGAGVPSFVLATSSDPIWALEKGCQQLLVADFVVDKKQDVFCLNGKDMKVYTHDGQFVWELGLGKALDACAASDINGDLKADIECAYKGTKQFTVIEGNGTQAIATATSRQIPETNVTLPEFAAVDGALLTGEQRVDLNGDGKPEERLQSDGKSLVILSGAQDVELARIDTKGEVVGALAKDLDGDGTLELVAVTRQHVFVISGAGKNVASHSANAATYKRQPVAQLSGLHANGFADNAQARTTVEGLQDSLAQCYAGRVRTNPYAGSGRLLIQLGVDDQGKVARTEVMHNEVNDKTIEKCVRETLQKAKFPAAASGQASVNVNMTFSFRDR